MSSETIIEYDQDILEVASQYGEAANRVATALDLESQGISSPIINGVILEEY